MLMRSLAWRIESDPLEDLERIGLVWEDMGA